MCERQTTHHDLVSVIPDRKERKKQRIMQFCNSCKIFFSGSCFCRPNVPQVAIGPPGNLRGRQHITNTLLFLVTRLTCPSPVRFALQVLDLCTNYGRGARLPHRVGGVSGSSLRQRQASPRPREGSSTTPSSPSSVLSALSSSSWTWGRFYSTSPRCWVKKHKWCSALTSSCRCRCLERGSNFNGSGQTSPQLGHFTQGFSRKLQSRTYSRIWPNRLSRLGPATSEFHPGSWQHMPITTCICMPSRLCWPGWESVPFPVLHQVLDSLALVVLSSMRCSTTPLSQCTIQKQKQKTIWNGLRCFPLCPRCFVSLIQACDAL